MTEDDYTNALEYLLTKLQKMDRSDTVEEINLLITRGRTVIMKDTADLKEKNIKQSEVGKTQTLPLTSQEALESAIDYLSKIIIDVPSYAQNISKVFGNNVVWEYDQSYSVKSINTSERFTLTDFTPNEAELEAAKVEVNRVKNLIKE